MKKVIALAVASAFTVPAFAADVTLSGDVEYKYTFADAGEAMSSGDQDIVVTGSEELSNGMTVTASIEMDGNSSSNNSDSSLSIDTGVMTIAVGDAVDFAAEAIDEKSDKAEAGGSGGDKVSTATGDTHTILLTFNPMENLDVMISRGTSTTSAASSVNIDSYAFQYSVMGATVGYGIASEEGQDEDASVLSFGYAMGPLSIGYESMENVASVENDDATNVGASYSMGSAKLFVESGEVKDASAGTKEEVTAYGASYAVGNLNTYLVLNSVKESASADDDQTIVGVEYKF